jgi:hypothetical protein
VPKGEEDHGGVAVTPSIVLRRLDQSFHFLLGEVLALPVFGINFAPRTACAHPAAEAGRTTLTAKASVTFRQ